MGYFDVEGVEGLHIFGEVQMTLVQIPSGLEEIYTKIVKRLEKSLTHRAAEVARNILNWVLGSARALTNG